MSSFFINSNFKVVNYLSVVTTVLLHGSAAVEDAVLLDRSIESSGDCEASNSLQMCICVVAKACRHGRASPCVT
jgi:hypothetical protein